MATQSNVVSVIAGRYASAVYDLADEARVLDETAADLKSLQAMLGESADLRTLIRSPVIDADAKAAAMGAILAQAGANGSEALNSEQMFAVAVIVLSTLLNAGYFLPIVYSAFFRPEDAPAGNPGHGHGEAPLAIVIALVTTATLTVAFFWLPDLALGLAGQLIGRGP